MPTTFFEAETVKLIADSLISTYHPELATARVKYLFQEKAGKKNGKPLFGKAQKCSGLLEHFADTDFLLIVGQDIFNTLEQQARVAAIDHLLECCTGVEDEKDPAAPMKWSTREPDIREFGTILSRYGAWNAELGGFISIAQGLLDEDTGVVQPVVRAATGTDDELAGIFKASRPIVVEV